MSTQAATERDGSGGPPRIRAPGFAGRTRELAALAAALAAPPALVLVEGEAGIGKTRLLQEYLAADPARRHRTLVADCPPFRHPHTLGPVADALRQAAGDARGLRLSALAGALRPLFPEWAPVLPPAPERAEDATAARHRLFRALHELLGCLRVRLLVTEDVHWADEATLEFLVYLASHQPGQLSLVITCRPEDVPPDSLLPRFTSRLAAGAGRYRMTLGPLDAVATAGLVSSMLSGGQVSDEFAAFVHERTEGVPLAVEESVQLMADRGELLRHADGWVRRSLAEIQVPPTIRSTVLERTRQLGQDAQAMLRAAAVLSEPADEGTLRAVAAMSADRARAGLSAALGCGLLAEDPRGLSKFRHALGCQAVYEAVPGPDRRMLHLRAGRALEGMSPLPAARLARHFREAGETSRWRRYGERAADLALASGDETAAVAFLHDLITNAALPADVMARLTGKLPFSALTGQARFRKLIHALRSALEDSTLGPLEEAEIRVQLGQALTHMQEWPEGRTELERAIPHLGHDPVASVRAMMLLAWPRGTTCAASVHLRWLRRAADHAVAMEPADRLRFAVDRASALLMLGEEKGWAEAAKIPLDAPATQAQREITRSHLNVGDQALRWGRYTEAAWRLRKALDLAKSHRYWRLHDDAQATRIHLDWHTGCWNGLAGRARSLADDDEIHFLTRLEAALVVGLLDAAAGAQAQAGARLRYVLAQTQQRAEMEYSMEPAAALARLWLADRRVEDALEVTAAPIGIVAGKGIWPWATDVAPARVAALTAAGRGGEAAELVTAFARGLRGRDAPAPRAALVLCRAMLAETRGQPARAAGLFARAAAAWQALPRPYDGLLARERQAGCLLAAGRREPGLALLSEVLRGLSRLGATGDADRTAGTLRSHGVAARVAWRGGRRGYGEQLSPREVEVVQQVLTGATNPQIARSLSRSPKTVAAQLNSAMRKLGVSSRTAVAVKAVEAGLAPAAAPTADGRLIAAPAVRDIEVTRPGRPGDL